MIGTINVRCNAAKPNFPLQPMFAFMGSPSSIRVLDVPKSIGTWEITSVRVAVLYPNNLTIEKVAVRTGSVWVATIEGCEVAGKVGNGLSILADGIDEDGSEVSGYVLGKGDVFILENDSDVKKLLEKYTVRYLDEVPAVASVGDLLNINGQVRLFDGERWLYISNGGEPTVVYDSEIKIKKNGVEVGSFTTNASEATTIDIPVPSTTSELVNDSGFITSSAIPSTVSSFENDVGYITASAIPPIPSQTSDLENDSGYITASAIPPIPSTTSDLVNNSGFITASAIPSQVSAFENDVGYLTATSSAVTQKRDKTDLSYSYIYNPSEYWNIPRWVVVYDGSTFNLDKYNSEKLEWTDGSGNWSVKVDFAGMEVTPYFTLFYQTTGVLAMTPTEGSGSTTWNFTLLGEPGTVEMDMDGTLTTVDAVQKVVDERIVSKRDYDDITYYATSETYSAYTHGISTFTIATTWNNIGEQTTNAPTVSANTTTWALDNGFGVLTSDGSTFYFQQSGSAVGSSFTMDELKAGAVRRVFDLGSYEGINVTANANFFKTTFALKDYVDAQIGSINTALDTINGEVI